MLNRNIFSAVLISLKWAASPGEQDYSAHTVCSRPTRPSPRSRVEQSTHFTLIRTQCHQITIIKFVYHGSASHNQRSTSVLPQRHCYSTFLCWGGMKKIVCFFRRKSNRGAGGLAESKISLSEKMRFFWIFFYSGGGAPIFQKGVIIKNWGFLDIFSKRGGLTQSIEILK